MGPNLNITTFLGCFFYYKQSTCHLNTNSNITRKPAVENPGEDKQALESLYIEEDKNLDNNIINIGIFLSHFSAFFMLQAVSFSRVTESVPLLNANKCTPSSTAKVG